MDTATVSRDAYLWAARQIVRQHEEQAATVRTKDPATYADWVYPTHATGCRHCPADDGECRLLVGARAELRAAGEDVARGGPPPRCPPRVTHN
jgi:hypothetical protein